MTDLTYFLNNTINDNCRRIRVSKNYMQAKGYMNASINILHGLFVSGAISSELLNYFERKLHESFVDGGFANKWQTEQYRMKVSKSRRKIFKNRARL